MLRSLRKGQDWPMMTATAHSARKTPGAGLRILGVVLALASALGFAYGVERHTVVAEYERMRAVHLDKAEQHLEKGRDKEADRARIARSARSSTRS